jgi:hypothetical protein
MTQQETARYLRETLTTILPMLNTLNDSDAGIRPQPTKWSPKEIIGHLIDSACNNHQKFVRTIAQPHLDFVGYKQDLWVESQHYSERSWSELLVLWQAYNLHLAHIIEHTPDAALQHTISVEGVGPFKLGFIMPDYVEHLKHHIRQIFPESVIESAFQNIYNA